MPFRRLTPRLALCVTLLLAALALPSHAQQVVQRGPLGVPLQVLDENGQWSTPIQLLSNDDLDIYMPDVSNIPWLEHNAASVLDKGQYTLTVFSFYKTRKVCRADQIGSGYSDAAHIDACNTIRYRIRQIAVDTNQKTVTLLLAAMVGEDGTVDPSSVLHDTRTRGVASLDPESQAALKKANAIIQKQAIIYDRRTRGTS